MKVKLLVNIYSIRVVEISTAFLFYLFTKWFDVKYTPCNLDCEAFKMFLGIITLRILKWMYVAVNDLELNIRVFNRFTYIITRILPFIMIFLVIIEVYSILFQVFMKLLYYFYVKL